MRNTKKSHGRQRVKHHDGRWHLKDLPSLARQLAGRGLLRSLVIKHGGLRIKWCIRAEVWGPECGVQEGTIRTSGAEGDFV